MPITRKKSMADYQERAWTGLVSPYGDDAASHAVHHGNADGMEEKAPMLSVMGPQTIPQYTKNHTLSILP